MSLANKLTLARIAMVPVFLVLAEIPFPRSYADRSAGWVFCPQAWHGFRLWEDI